MTLHIKGATNVGKLLDAISDTQLQCLVTLDDFQAQQKDKNYTVEIVYPNYSGEYFELIKEE